MTNSFYQYYEQLILMLFIPSFNCKENADEFYLVNHGRMIHFVTSIYILKSNL